LDHPSDHTLKRFAAGNSAREENRAVVAHLLKSCGRCAVKLKAFLEPDSVAGQAYDPVLDKFDEGLLDALEPAISPLQTLQAVLRGGLVSARRPARADEDQ
jgi:hypothetical protein